MRVWWFDGVMVFFSDFGLSSELLKDETLDIDLITPTLPAFKSLVSVDSHTRVRDRYDSLIHGILSSCLLNVDEMRSVLFHVRSSLHAEDFYSGREGLISSKKVNSNLLAAVLILTSLPSRVKVARGVVEHLCFVISQKLEENDDVRLPLSTIIMTSEVKDTDSCRCCPLRKNHHGRGLWQRPASYLRAAFITWVNPFRC
jgi:hypothetical protein